MGAVRARPSSTPVAPATDPGWGPTYRLVAFWLLLVAPLLAIPVPPVAPRLALLALHVGLAMLILSRPAMPVRWPRGAGLLSRFWDWAPLLAVPLFYWETPILMEAVHRGAVYDPLVQAWEAALFGGQPSITLSARWPWLWLSEALHGAYLSYYFIVLVPPLALYLAGRRDAFRRVVFTVVLAILLHQAMFIAFPVVGPRYLFPAPAGGLEVGPLYQLTHRLLETASSAGTAFPSSHVGVSVAVTIALFRERARGAPWVALLTTLLAISTVYGGFHYAVDALAGVGSGALAALLAPALRARLVVNAPATTASEARPALGSHTAAGEP